MCDRNWKKYNKQLVQRGSITFLIDPKIFKELKTFKPKSTFGRPLEYPQSLIEILLSVKIQFSLTYRSLEGFAKSVFEKIKKWFRIPTYSTICKRAKELLVILPKLSSKRPKIILLDASGIKVYGEGEWKRKIHGVGRPRKWVKMHIAVDEVTQEVVAESLTESNIADSSMTKNLLDQIPDSIKIVKADGAYDRSSSRNAIREKQAKALIPPPRNAQLGKDPDRDKALLQIRGFGNDELARSLWGKMSTYSYRSLVETAFSRYKRLFGGKLFSQTTDRQIVENRLKWLILNKMLRII